jgi:eukaryotic-like serine/threonine-protein kinase
VSALAEPAVAPPLVPGAELAPGYTVVGHLSRNQALDVYEVHSAHRDCRCVAKVLRPDSRGNPRRRERLEREGALLQRFTHPHVVRAYETLHEPELVVVLETLAGDRLDHLLREGPRRMAAVEVAMLGVHLSSAVGYLHREGWLHLDLKPGNVIVDLGMAKLLDLSLAQPGPTHAGRARYGTRGYLSPEQVAGGTFTVASDVFGLGCVLYEAATRRCPGAGAGGAGGADRPPPVATLRRLPGGLGKLIDACLAADPADRPGMAEIGRVCATVAQW